MAGRITYKSNYCLIFFILTFTFFGCQRNEAWLENLPKPWKINEEEFSSILQKFGNRYPEFNNRLKQFSKWQVGKPYKIFCLGEETLPDPDPIFRMDVSDCTVHILTSLASIQSQNWNQAKSNLIKIHYKADMNGINIPSYKKRWHFTTDRLLFNPSTKNITDTLLDEQDIQRINLTLNQKENGDEFLDLDWTKNVSVSYIPNNMINNELLNELPSIAGVAFVKKSYFKMGLAIAHEGMIIDNQDIIHASQEYEKTVQMNFLDYYFTDEGPRFDGVMFFTFHPLGS
tara:strand:+ start:19413 stop:20270 length:858 start_codon:yes stop_codon:yes gene_type:complete